MPIMATWMRGVVVVNRPLPSLVTRQMLPVSATPKLTPLIPISACKKSARSMRRARAVMLGTSARSASVALSFSRNRPATCCRLL